MVTKAEMIQLWTELRTAWKGAPRLVRKVLLLLAISGFWATAGHYYVVLNEIPIGDEHYRNGWYFLLKTLPFGIFSITLMLSVLAIPAVIVFATIAAFMAPPRR